MLDKQLHAEQRGRRGFLETSNVANCNDMVENTDVGLVRSNPKNVEILLSSLICRSYGFIELCFILS